MGKKPDLPKGYIRFRFLKRHVSSSKQRKSISRHHRSGAEAVVSVDVAGLHGDETVVAACLLPQGRSSCGCVPVLAVTPKLALFTSPVISGVFVESIKHGRQITLACVGQYYYNVFTFVFGLSG